ncbi:MAG: PhnD/SsuA/transferrin family substrate-binding protein [Acidimicrobiia bacterium]|nr:PhnD/SsuA/transferrin family substrate-binding protein [Acidimicrobiia bacterium]
MIASLPMYLRPELADAHDRYWSLIRGGLEAAGIAAPERLSQDAAEEEVWLNPGLVLSQTCGMPYRIRLHERVALVGTPDFGLDGCSPGYYRSAIVVRADDPRRELGEFRDAVFAYNQTDSQSGYAAMYHHVAALGFWFERTMLSGGHAKSVEAVASGQADVASIDAVSWRLIERYGDTARELRVIDWTEPTPGLPYIAAGDAKVRAVAAAVTAAIDGLADDDRAALGIRALVSIPRRAYLAIPNPGA